MISSDGSSVVSGEFIFKLMDTHGLPFDIIQCELKDRGLAFNVVEFIHAAIKSKNFTRKRLTNLLLDHAPSDEAREKVLEVIDHIWRTPGLAP